MTKEELTQIAYTRAQECRVNMYKSESKVWDLLQRHNDAFGLEWQTQIPVIVPSYIRDTYGGKAFYIVDFLEPNSNIVIEVDGEQHNRYDDDLRDYILWQLGYTTYRIKSLEVWKWHILKDFICGIYDKEGIIYNKY